MPEQQTYVEPADRPTRVSDLVLRYGVILGKRFTQGQKRRFLAAAAQQFELSGFGPALEEDKHAVKTAGAKRFFNLYAGDLRHADVVFVTYYDTPAKSLVPKTPIRPFRTNFQVRNMWASMALLAAIVFAAAVLIWCYLWPQVAGAGMFSLWGLLLLVCCVVVLAVVTNCREGFAEKDNVVRNSSSLAVLFDLAHEIADAGLSNKVAFALLDEGCRSERGLQMLDVRLGKRSPKRVYLDSLGSDGEVVCLTNSRIPGSWSGKVLVARLDTALRKKYGDYLVCAGRVGDDGTDVFVDTAGEVTTEKVMDRTSLLFDLIRVV